MELIIVLQCNTAYINAIIQPIVQHRTDSMVLVPLYNRHLVKQHPSAPLCMLWRHTLS